MKTWKVGLIGTGWWSDKHLDAWARIPNVEIAALCNRSRPKMENRAAEYGVPANRLYDDADDMFANAGIDVVDIVTGPESHLAYVRKAAAAGKHILCQKPFAPSYEEAEAMVLAAEEAGVRLMVTENWRWLMPFRIIRAAIESGKLGKIRVARYIHTDWYTPRMAPGIPLPQPFFRDMPYLLFYEMGAHWFDTWRSLFGTPKRLYAEVIRISPYIAGDDSGIVTLGYDDWYGYMDMSWATRQKLENPPSEPVWPGNLEQMVIDGDRATLKLFTGGRIILISQDGKSETVLAEKTWLDHGESYYLLSSHFIECMETGKEFATSGRDNLMTMAMIFGTYMSTEQHKVVTLQAVDFREGCL